LNSTAQLALYGALLAGFLLAALWRPPVSIAAILCIYGLKQWGQTSSAWLAAHGTFTNFAIGVIVLIALVVRAMRGKCVLCNVRGSTAAVIALYLYALLSLLWTPRPDLALDMWGAGAPYVVTAVLLAPLAVHDSEDLYRGYFALLIFGGVLVFALLLFAKWGDRGVLISGVGTDETNPLAIASLGGAVAGAAMFLRTRRFPVVSWILRLVLVAAALAVVVKTGSRGQLIATLGTLVLMLPVAFNLSQVRGLIPILIAVAVVGFAGLYIGINAASHSAFIGSEGRSAIDWLYFSVTTMATIGDSEIRPTSTWAQVAVIAQLSTGPLLLSWLIAVFASQGQPVGDGGHRHP